MGQGRRQRSAEQEQDGQKEENKRGVALLLVRDMASADLEEIFFFLDPETSTLP